MKYFPHCFLIAYMVSALFAVTPQESAAALSTEFDRNIAIWNVKMKNASSDGERVVLASSCPDAQKYGDVIISKINRHVKEDWTVPHMAWLLRNHPQLMIQKMQPDGSVKILDRERIFMEYVEKYHVKSLHAGVFAVSMMFSNNTGLETQVIKRRLAEKIYTEHANKNNKVMGAAALARGHFTPVVEGDLALIKTTLSYYQTAAHHAADVKVGNTSVGELVSEKYYVMNNLEPGRPVPLIEGSDALGRKHQMVERKGKLVLICFWSSKTEKFDLLAEQLNKITKSGKGKKFELIGVTTDDVNTVRKQIGDGVINWRNFMDVKGQISNSFRVEQTPFCYIISPKGLILYRGGLGGPLFGAIIASHLVPNE